MLVLWHVIYRACSEKVLLRRNSAWRKQIACVLLVICYTVACNCCRNVILGLKSSTKLCLFLQITSAFDLIIRSKNINWALIEAYCAALNQVSCRCRANSALFLESNVNSTVTHTVSAVVMPYVGQFLFSVNCLALWWVIFILRRGTAVLLFILQQRLELRCIKAWRCHFPTLSTVIPFAPNWN